MDAPATALRVALTYDQRLLRRKKLQTTEGQPFFVDLPQTVSVVAGGGFVLDDGRVVAIEAAREALYAVTGPEIIRYAWHIGNRHTPCEIQNDTLVIQRDPVLRGMLEGLGAQVTDIEAPFSPEGGAYGHGRTMGHDHGGHGHDHAHDGGHGHLHSHDHYHDHDHHHDHDHSHPPHTHD